MRKSRWGRKGRGGACAEEQEQEQIRKKMKKRSIC